MRKKLTQKDFILIEKALANGARAEVGIERGEIVVVEVKRKLLTEPQKQKKT